jgi:hypothetical protein
VSESSQMHMMFQSFTVSDQCSCAGQWKGRGKSHASVVSECHAFRVAGVGSHMGKTGLTFLGTGGLETGNLCF